MSRNSLLTCTGLLLLLGCQADRQTAPEVPAAEFAVAARTVTYRFPTAGGGHSCVYRVNIGVDSTLLCWGSDNVGQVGAGIDEISKHLRPVPVKNGRLLHLSQAGSQFTCATDIGGNKPNCWGSNLNGQMGRGPLFRHSSYPEPLPVATTLVFRSMVTGQDHACGVTWQGIGYCWGSNAKGQLGTNSTANQSVPTPIYAGRIWRYMAAGAQYTCGLEEYTYIVYCWGDNAAGQLGTGDAVNRLYPSTRVAGTWSTISAGLDHTCATSLTGYGYCWGGNTYFQMGHVRGGGLQLPNYNFSPKPVSFAGRFGSISAGHQYTCAVVIESTREAYCWGRSNYGQLGNGTTTTRNTPVRVAGGHGFQYLDTGATHVVAVTNTGSVLSWGAGFSGQLGVGNTVTSAIPVVTLP